MNVFNLRNRRDWIYGGFRVGKIKGIEIRLHWALPLLWLFFFFTINFRPGGILINSIEFLIIVGVIFGSVLLHELGHCYGGHLMGERAHSVLLWPLGGLATIEGTQRSPYNEFIITLAGPLVSLALALVGSIGYFTLKFLPPTTIEPVFYIYLTFAYFITYLMSVNWMLFLFNMLVPLFPMDSARLIRSKFSMNHDAGKVTYRICLAGLFVAGAMVMLSLMQFVFPGMIGFGVGPVFLLIAVFGLQTCLQQMNLLQFQEVYSDEIWNHQRYDELTRAARHPMKTFRRFREMRRRRKRPAKVVQLYSESEILQSELDEAVKNEDFVRAAELRDKIKKLGERKRSSK